MPRMILWFGKLCNDVHFDYIGFEENFVKKEERNLAWKWNLCLGNFGTQMVPWLCILDSWKAAWI